MVGHLRNTLGILLVLSFLLVGTGAERPEGSAMLVLTGAIGHQQPLIRLAHTTWTSTVLT